MEAHELLHHAYKLAKLATFPGRPPLIETIEKLRAPPCLPTVPVHKCKRSMPPAIFRVLEATGDAFNVMPDELVTKNRTVRIVQPRQVVCFILHRDMKRSLPQIGRWLGGRDHTTVLHSVRQVEKRYPAIAEIIDAIRLTAGVTNGTA